MSFIEPLNLLLNWNAGSRIIAVNMVMNYTKIKFPQNLGIDSTYINDIYIYIYTFFQR